MLALALLLALSGCAGLLGPDGGSDATTGATTETPADTAIPTTMTSSPSPSASSPTATPTATPPETVDPANPFGQRTVPVAIPNRTARRTHESVVRRALTYWERNGTAYAGYPVEFTLVDPSEDHRIAVAFESPPIACGGDADRTIGCAPVNERRAPAVSTVTVAASQTTDYTYEILVHELGHALGLDHDDRPRRYMRGTLPQGLNRETVHVFLTGPDATEIARKRGEIETALSYYETHPDLPAGERPTFEYVTTVEQADFVVEIGNEGCFDDRGGVCGGEPRYDGQVKLVIDSLDTRFVAWYTAHALADFYLDDVPRDLSTETTRSDRANWDG